MQDDRLSLPTITSLCSHIRENHCHFLLHLYILHFFNSPFPPAAALQLVQQMMSLKSLIISFPQYIQNSFPALPPSICLSLSRCSFHPAQLLSFPSVYAHLFVCSLLLLTIISSSISSQLFSITLLPPSSTASTWKLIDIVSKDVLPTYCFCSFSLSSSQKAEILFLQQLRGSWEQMTDGLSLLPYPITSALAFFESPSHLLQKVVLLVTRLFITHLGHFLDPSILHFPADSFSFFLSSLQAPGKKTDQPTGIKFTQCEVPWKVVRVRPLPVL